MIMARYTADAVARARLCGAIFPVVHQRRCRNWHDIAAAREAAALRSSPVSTPSSHCCCSSPRWRLVAMIISVEGKQRAPTCRMNQNNGGIRSSTWTCVRFFTLATIRLRWQVLIAAIAEQGNVFLI